MNSIFNSPFELSLRILILMKTRNSRVTVEWLSCLDFVTTYGKDFGVSEFNLHGDNEYRFSEYAAKREVIGIAIKELQPSGKKRMMARDFLNGNKDLKGKIFHD